MAEKRYYWMKLPEDFFETDVIDWLMEQPNGKDYVIFYLRLCLKTVKTEGVLIRTVGNLLIPYDAKKLAEITKTEIDTVVIALKLLQEVGLIEILEGGELYLTAMETMVGNESGSAKRVREHRKRKGALQCNTDVTKGALQCNTEKEIEIENRKEKVKKESADKRRFTPPTTEEVFTYCQEKGLEYLDPQAFIDFYESKGWMVGRSKMKDWKAAARRWNRGNQEEGRAKASWALKEQRGVRQGTAANSELNKRLASMGG